MFQLFDNLDTLSIVDYVLIFGAVSFIIVVISKVMSVTMTFVRLTLKRIKSGPTKDREIEIEDYEGDFERKAHPKLVEDGEIRNFVTETSERYQFLSNHKLDMSNDASEYRHVIKTKLPKNKKATDDMFTYVLWNYVVKNKAKMGEMLADYKLGLQQPKAILTEYDMPDYQDEVFIEESHNVVSYTNYRRFERELCGALLQEIREQESSSNFEIIVKLAYIDVLGIRQIEDKSYDYTFISEMMETMPFAQDLVLDLSHRYADIMKLNEHYVRQNLSDKQVFNNYRRDVSKLRPYRDQSIVRGITMPFRKFREIEQKLCRDILLKRS